MNQLEQLWEHLKYCDEIILNSLLMRNRITEDIMVYKEEHGMSILQLDKEQSEKDWLTRRLQGKEHPEEIENVSVPLSKTARGYRRGGCSTTIFSLSVLWARARPLFQITLIPCSQWMSLRWTR